MSQNSNVHLIRDFLKLRSLSNTKRYPLYKTVNTESVSVHSYNVTVFGVLLYNDLKDYFIENNINFDYSKFLELLLFHDVGEIFTSDIDYDFKTFLKQNSNYRELESIFISYCMKEFSPGLFPTNVENAIQEKSDNSIEASLVSFIDMIDVVFYSFTEVFTFNNFSLLEVLLKSIAIAKSRFEQNPILQQSNLLKYLFHELDSVLAETNLLESTQSN